MVRSPNRVNQAGQVTKIGQQYTPVVRTVLRDEFMTTAHKAIAQMLSQRKADDINQVHLRWKPNRCGQRTRPRRHDFLEELEVVTPTFAEQPGGEEAWLCGEHPFGKWRTA